jgi:ferredoxin
MVCRVRILAGDECIEPAEDEEIDALRERLGISVDRDPIRLGCRLRVRCDGVVVEKQGVVGPEA